MKMNRWKTIILIVSIAVLMYLIIAGIAGRSSTNLENHYFGTPEAAFYERYQTEPYIALPCGNHVHMYGKDKSTPYDKNGLDVHVVAEEEPAGWHITEKTSLYAVRADLGPECWDSLTIETQAKCHNNLINIAGVLPLGADSEDILNEVTDSVGTEFVICTQSTSVGEVFFVFGLADVQQRNYDLYFGSEHIYP